MHLTRSEIEESDKIFQLNLINSISGIKPGNLIGTSSLDKIENLAIFSSVVHFGSDPPLLGFVVRPDKNVRRHTLENIINTNVFTVNHIRENDIEKAHYTSVKFDEKISEFDPCGFTSEYIHGFDAPFVKESSIKIGLSLEDIITIKNGTRLIIGKIENLSIPNEIISENGYVNLAENQSIGISGLNTYYRLEKITSFPFARLENIPDFSK